jgi:hypothetical protein
MFKPVLVITGKLEITKAPTNRGFLTKVSIHAGGEHSTM